MKPTLPQQFILDTIFSNLKKNYIILGVPGAGKTTLISMIANQLSEQGETDILALTFSSVLATDTKEKLKNGTAQTAHSYMLQCLKNYLSLTNNLARKGQAVKTANGFTYSNVNDNLVDTLCFHAMREVYGIPLKGQVPPDKVNEFYREKFMLMNCVNKIRSEALNYTSQLTEIHEALDATYTASVVSHAVEILKQLTDRFLLRGITDFTGMLYLPVVIEDLSKYIKSPKFLILDEINDTTPLLFQAYKLISKDSQTVIGLGDVKQTIHVWAGTRIDIIDRMISHFNAQTLEYEFTFRVPRVMCKYLQESKIDTRIKPYDTINVEGEIHQNVKYLTFLNTVKHGDAVICRYNRGNKVKHTLQAISIELILKRKRVAFIGSTHIEDITDVLTLASPMHKSCKSKQQIKDHVIKSIKNAIAEEISSKGLSKPNRRCQDLEEKLQSFILYFDFFCATQLFSEITMSKFIPFLQGMYVNSKDAIQLISGHKSKGLEYDNGYIVHLDAVVSDITNQQNDINFRKESHNLLLVMLSRFKKSVSIVDCSLPELLPEP